MEICRYLAMTRQEMENFALPEGFSRACLAWEAGLADLKAEGSLLVLTDRHPLPPAEAVQEAVETFRCAGVVLDFQKPGQEAAAKALCLPCPVGVSELYAPCREGPVFLSPCPPDRPLDAHLAPWQGREIWLDVSPEVLVLTLTGDGCAAASSPRPPDGPCFTDENLCCRYRCEVFPDKAVFTLWRDKQMLEAHMEQAQTLGVTKTIGLFQEWKSLL